MSSPSVVYAGGWWAERHVGDDAILRSHLGELRRRAPGARPLVLGPTPEVLHERFGVEAMEGIVSTLLGGLDPNAPGVTRVLASRSLAVLRVGLAHRANRGEPQAPPRLRDAVKAIAGAEALVVTGAGALASEHGAYGLWPLATTAALARILGTPTVISGIGAGPFVGPLDRLAVGLGLRGTEWISVRDREVSKRQLRSLLLRCTEDWDDAAWLPAAPLADARQVLAAAGIEPGAGFAAVTVAPTGDQGFGLAGLARTAERLHAERGLRTVAISMDMNLPDRTAIGGLRRATGGRVTELWPLPSDATIRAVLGDASVCFGGRYHAALFSALEGTPVLLTHRSDYQRLKAIGLTSMVGERVRAVQGDAPEAVSAATIEALDRGRREAICVTRPLRAAAWVARRIEGRR